ncbi:MAG: hypothetical protein ACLQAT_23935 [Candidatus Binataceae bacterium]
MTLRSPIKPGQVADSQREEIRAGFRRLSTSVEIADLIGVLMILVTGLSAYATWTTARLASQLLTITARPYLGVQGVRFDRTDSNEPRVLADLRNFGSVQATDAVITGHLLFDGKEVAGHRGPRSTIYAGVFSPGVPHPTYFHLPVDIYHSALDGRGKLQLHLEMRYKGLNGDSHCYAKSFSYDDDDAEFYSDHGTLECQ